MTLHATPACETQAAPDILRDFSNLSILCVDASAHMRRIYRTILTGYHAHGIHLAHDGPSALQMFFDGVPDLVVCDWDIPGMRPLELVQTLRNRAASANPYVPILICTALADAARVCAARDAGVNEFLVKPISAKGFYLRARSCLAAPRQFVETPNFFGPDRRRFGVYSDLGAEDRRGRRRPAPPASPPDAGDRKEAQP
ncbi:MAG: response regulator [Beijerinckiaceae bacterium]